MKLIYIQTNLLLDSTNEAYDCVDPSHIFSLDRYTVTTQTPRNREEMVAPVPSPDDEGGKFGDKRDNTNKNKQ